MRALLGLFLALTFIFSGPELSDRLFVGLYKHHCSFYAFHFTLDCRLLRSLLCLLFGLLFMSQECPLKEFLRHFDVVGVCFKSRVWMVKIKKQFISASIQNPNYFAVLHYSYDSAVLEHTLNSLIVIGGKMAEILHFHFFENCIWPTCHQGALCYLLSVVLYLWNCSFLCFRIWVMLLQYYKSRCKHFLGIVGLTSEAFFVLNGMNDKRDSVAGEFSKWNDIIQIGLQMRNEVAIFFHMEDWAILVDHYFKLFTSADIASWSKKSCHTVGVPLILNVAASVAIKHRGRRNVIVAPDLVNCFFVTLQKSVQLRIVLEQFFNALACLNGNVKQWLLCQFIVSSFAKAKLVVIVEIMNGFCAVIIILWSNWCFGIWRVHTLVKIFLLMCILSNKLTASW